MKEQQEFIDVYVVEKDGRERQCARITRYYADSRHPNRKWCYRVGVKSYYSNTAKTLQEMVAEYISCEVDWAYCCENGLQVKFVANKH